MGNPINGITREGASGLGVNSQELWTELQCMAPPVISCLTICSLVSTITGTSPSYEPILLGGPPCMDITSNFEEPETQGTVLAMKLAKHAPKCQSKQYEFNNPIVHIKSHDGSPTVK